MSGASGFDVDGAGSLDVPEGAAVEVCHQSLQPGLVGVRDDGQLQRAVGAQIQLFADDKQTYWYVSINHTHCIHSLPAHFIFVLGCCGLVQGRDLLTFLRSLT